MRIFEPIYSHKSRDSNHNNAVGVLQVYPRIDMLAKWQMPMIIWLLMQNQKN